MNITTTVNFCAAHRLMAHPGKCLFLHGHNYKAIITVDGKIGPCGMVEDFGVIKSVVLGAFDHSVILGADDPLLTAVKDQRFVVMTPPTAENIANSILDMTKASRVQLYETDDCCVEAVVR